MRQREMAMALEGIPESDKLRGSVNYHSWKVLVKHHLKGERLWNIVAPLNVLGARLMRISLNNMPTRVESSSASGTEPETADSMKQKGKQVETPFSEESDQELMYHQDRAMAILIKSCSIEIHPLISEIEDPRVAWEILQNHYEVKDVTRKLDLRNSLKELKISEDVSTESYLNEFRNINSQLIGIGVIIPNEELIEIILNALPSSYEAFLFGIEAQPVLPSLDVLMSKLIHIENIRSRKLGTRSNNSEALFVRSSRPNRSGPSEKTRVGPCNYCGRMGHLKRQCRERDTDIKKLEDARKARLDSQKAKLEVNIVDHESDSDSADQDESDSDVTEQIDMFELALSAEITNGEYITGESVESAMTTFLSPSSSTHWYIDNGASKHVTGTGGVVKNMEKPLIATKVRSAGDQAHLVIGTGSVSVKTTSGQTHSINEVLYIPGLRKNLLSVGSIADLGNKIIFDSTGCKIISKKSGQLIAQAKRDATNGLYRMDFAESSINSVETDSDEEQAKLWHQRMAHLNYQYLHYLSQKNLVKGLPPLPLLSTSHICSGCQHGKQQRE
jgi:hypothetical protein